LNDAADSRYVRAEFRRLRAIDLEDGKLDGRSPLA